MTGIVDAVERLIRRIAPNHADPIFVEVEDAPTTGRRASYSSHDGVLRLRGSDAVSIATAFYQYAKRECLVQWTWDDPGLVLPTTLPSVPLTLFETELTELYHLNFVTYGYSMPYWDWTRWEQELDWMALHGVTMPLMLVGHEAVLRAAFSELGLDDDAISAWLGSSAHFPWTWLGATNSWGGPVPKRWDDRHVDLAQRILARMRELGMTPVLPGFAGHVPPQIAADPDWITWQGWRTPVLRPAATEFQIVADAIMRHQRALFGTNHHYAIDPFIESIPPDDRPEYLRRFGAGIYAGLTATDPEAVWVLQGWPFHFHREFWTDERATAFLSGIPHERLLLLDLWAEHAPMWGRTDGMYGRKWLWGMVHNFGGRFAVFGDLRGVHDGLKRARKSAGRGELVGAGMTMEAIENNAVVYELLTDSVWDASLDVRQWLDAYVRQRYRIDDVRALEAWRVLGETLYGPGRTRSIPSPIIARPWIDALPFAAQRSAGEFVDTGAEPQRQSANIDAENDPTVLGDLPEVARALSLLVSVSERVSLDGAIGRDIVDLAIHALSQHARLPIRAMLAAYERNDIVGLRDAMRTLEDHIELLDDLASTRSESMIGTWTAAARSWADDEREAAHLERDARTLLTVWGHQDSGLHDYSGRHWSGMLRDFYLPRWQTWAKWLEDAATTGGHAEPSVLHASIVSHEEQWRRARNHYPTEPSGDLRSLARAAVAMAGSN